jgi:hypothetical protein
MAASGLAGIAMAGTQRTSHGRQQGVLLPARSSSSNMHKGSKGDGEKGSAPRKLACSVHEELAQLGLLEALPRHPLRHHLLEQPAAALSPRAAARGINSMRGKVGG